MLLELRRLDDRTGGLTTGRADVALLRGDVGAPGLVTELLLDEARLAVVPAGSALADKDELSLADLVPLPLVFNTVAGTTTLDLWPSGSRPSPVIEVGNTDEWMTAIAAGRGAGITTEATPSLFRHPGIAFRPLADAPPVPLYVAWRRGAPTHRSVPDLVDLAHEIASGV